MKLQVLTGMSEFDVAVESVIATIVTERLALIPYAITIIRNNKIACVWRTP